VCRGLPRLPVGSRTTKISEAEEATGEGGLEWESRYFGFEGVGVGAGSLEAFSLGDSCFD